MKLHFVATAAAAVLFAAMPAQASSILQVGRLPAQDCAAGAARANTGNIGYAARNGALANCDLALSRTQLPRDRTATLVNRGVLKAVMGDTDAAIADYDAALTGDPQSASAYVSRGAALMHGNRNDEARADFSRAISLGVSDPHIAYFNRAIAEEKLGDVSAAYHDYKKALALAPDFKPAVTELARFHVERRYAASQ